MSAMICKPKCIVAGLRPCVGWLQGRNHSTLLHSSPSNSPNWKDQLHATATFAQGAFGGGLRRPRGFPIEVAHIGSGREPEKQTLTWVGSFSELAGILWHCCRVRRRRRAERLPPTRLQVTRRKLAAVEDAGFRHAGIPGRRANSRLVPG